MSYNLEDTPAIVLDVPDVLDALPDVGECGDEGFILELDQVISDSAEVLKPEYLYKIYDDVELRHDHLIIDGRTIHCGRKIVKQLRNSTQIAVAICTVGEGISDLYQQYSTDFDFVKAYLCDAVANLATEKTMKALKEQLSKEMALQCKKITSHQGPGHCDWDITGQAALFSLLPTEPCGITLTESSLMIPMKSLSAMIGIGENVVYKESDCSICHLTKCIYRKDRFKNN